MADTSIPDIARDMISQFGSEAAAMIDAHILRRIGSGDRDGAIYWAKIGAAVRAMNGEIPLERSPTTIE
jgi:hypothetical protein